jgi:hypothetical protein
MPFIKAASGKPNAIATLPTSRDKPIGFWWGDSKAWIDNDMKIVAGNIGPGQVLPLMNINIGTAIATTYEYKYWYCHCYHL